MSSAGAKLWAVGLSGSMKISSEHTEEEVFETPDLPPSSSVWGPVDPEVTGDEQFEDADIDGSHTQPGAAFQAFWGRRFDPEEVDLSASIAPRRKHGSAKPPLETPLQTFTRLKVEVSSLSDQLAALSETDAKWLGAGPTADPSSPAHGVWPELTKGVEALQSQLAAMEEASSLAPHLRGELRVSSEEAAAQSALSDKLDKVGAATADGATSPVPADAPTPSASLPKSSSAPSSTATMSALDARLARIERALGAAATGDGGAGTAIAAGSIDASGGVLQALHSLEQRIAVLDEAAYAEMTRRARILASEIKAVSSTPSGRRVATNALTDAQLSSMHDTLRQWDGVAQELPTVISRLQTLSVLHTEAALFSQRLASLEQSNAALESSVAAAETVTRELQQGFSETLTVVQKNVSALDERFAGLGK